MIDYLSVQFSRYSRGWLILAMIAIFILYSVTMFPGTEESQTPETVDLRPVDILFFYTPDEVYDLVERYGADRRASYRIFELTVDILYPIIYTGLMGITISWVFRRAFDPASRLQKLNVIPLGAGIFDVLENICIAGILTVYPGRPPLLAWAATAFTMIKWTTAFLSIGLILFGLAVMVFKPRLSLG